MTFLEFIHEQMGGAPEEQKKDDTLFGIPAAEWPRLARMQEINPMRANKEAETALRQRMGQESDPEKKKLIQLQINQLKRDRIEQANAERQTGAQPGTSTVGPM